MASTLLDKVWEAHTVRTLPSGQTQLLIGLHLIHEVTTPQAFQMLGVRHRPLERLEAAEREAGHRPQVPHAEVDSADAGS